jgi:hypothetical protein
MTIAGELANRILKTAMPDEIVDFHTIFEALKMTLGTIGCLALDDLEESDPAVAARIEDVTRAITRLQEEIAGVIAAKT